MQKLAFAKSDKIAAGLEAVARGKKLCKQEYFCTVQRLHRKKMEMRKFK
jgi:hypothetical protein